MRSNISIDAPEKGKKLKLLGSILSVFGAVDSVIPPADVPVEELTLWEELVEYFKTKYFLSYAGIYDNFTIGESSAMSIAIIIIGLIVGMIIAVIAGYFRNRTSGVIVRRLTLQSAFSEKDAKTLEELGIENTFGVRFSLRSRSFLRKYVHYVGEPVFSSDSYVNAKKAGSAGDAKRFGGYNPYIRDEIDYKNARFYIPEDIRYKAEVRYEQKGIGNSPIAVLLCIVGLIALGVVCLRVFPTLLQMADNLVTMISKK